MDLVITGIIDILIIIFALLAGFIGYKRGFMNKALSIIGVLVIFAFSILFCVQLAGLLKSSGFIYNSLYNTMYKKIDGNLYERFAVTVEKSFGLHPAVATIIAFVFGNPPKNMTIEETADVIAFKATTIIAFLIIFITLSLVLLILKIIVGQMREQKVIRKIDGIFGIFLYIVLYACLLLVIFFVLNLIYNHAGIEDFNHWLEVDLALNDSHKFRIGKYLLENNYLVAIINLFINK